MARVLLIEDEVFSRDILKDILVKAGHQVISTRDGSEGLTQLGRHPDLEVVVSDVVMPDLDGLKVLAQIKIVNPALPVILLTARQDEAMMLKAIRLGAFDFQKKPVSLVELALAVDRAAAHHHLLLDQKAKLERLAALESGARRLNDLIGEEFPLELMAEEYSILEGIVKLITEILNCERASVLLVDPQDQWLRVAVSVGLSPELIREENRPAQKSVSSFVLETGQPLLVRDIATDARVDEAAFSSQYKTRSFVIAPLRIRDRIIGTITANDKGDGGAFGDYDLYFLGTLASQASATIARAIHMSHLKRDREQLARQTELLRILIHCLEPEEMLDNLLIKCQQLIGAANVSLFLIDEPQRNLVRLVGYNAGEKITKPHPIPIGVSITGKAAKFAQPCMANDPHRDPDFKPEIEWRGKGKIRNLLVIPLTVGDATLGVLRLLNKIHGEFSYADMSLLDNLAASLSAAVHNMRLHEQLGRSVEEAIEANRALQKLNDDYILQASELEALKRKVAGGK